MTGAEFSPLLLALLPGHQIGDLPVIDNAVPLHLVQHGYQVPGAFALAGFPVHLLQIAVQNLRGIPFVLPGGRGVLHVEVDLRTGADGRPFQHQIGRQPAGEILFQKRTVDPVQKVLVIIALLFLLHHGLGGVEAVAAVFFAEAVIYKVPGDLLSGAVKIDQAEIALLVDVAGKLAGDPG